MPKRGMTVEKLLAEENWHTERIRLREIMCDTELEEHVKWGQLCYTLHDDGGNVAIIFVFKVRVGVGFFKGALLDDPDERLTFQGENSVATKEMAFTSLAQIEAGEQQLRAFVREAADNERKGLEVPRDARQIPDPPEELSAAFEDDPELQKAFANLTPGRQRGYLIHFTGAKTSEARARRIAKYTPKILAGKGMNDWK